MSYQNLFFSSIDLVCDKNGSYYFIENNYNSQWLWLENITGIKMSDCFVNIINEELNSSVVDNH
jgi:hypothetical protein